MPTREQVAALSAFYKEDSTIILAYLSDKLINEFEYEKLGLKVMKIAEKKIRIASSRKDKKVDEQFSTVKPI